MISFFKQIHTNIRVSMHAVLSSSVRDEARAGQEVIYLTAGCSWGIERALWSTPGVMTTVTGYMGRHSTNPTYGQVCSHSTGRAETVRVVFDTALTSATDLVRLFFEIRDLTRVGGQGNDIGDQYHSAIWTTTPGQLRDATALHATYQEVLTKRGFGPIQTAISPAPNADSTARPWYTEDYHRQYLFKNPGGYEYHARTDVTYPVLPHE